MNPEQRDSSPTDRSPAAGAHDCAQRLSCLLDGELSAQECEALVQQMHGDDEACRRWALMSCVGDALRSAEVGAWHAQGFTARVSAALEREPTVLAPAAVPPPAMRRWLLPGAGAAVAAAVLIAVGLPQRQPAAPEALARRESVAAPVVASPARAVQVDRSPELERYLAAHREFAESTVMPRSTPYLRTSSAPAPREPR
jgi:sigma-E factor negative regulatory protein RseA